MNSWILCLGQLFTIWKWQSGNEVSEMTEGMMWAKQVYALYLILLEVEVVVVAGKDIVWNFEEELENIHSRTIILCFRKYKI